MYGFYGKLKSVIKILIAFLIQYRYVWEKIITFTPNRYAQST